MQNIFSQVIEINQMENNNQKQDAAEKFLKKVNNLDVPDHFNWAQDVFEGIHVRSNPDKTALIWQDLDHHQKASYSYRQVSKKANQILNCLSRAGVRKGDISFLASRPKLPYIRLLWPPKVKWLWSTV